MKNLIYLILFLFLGVSSVYIAVTTYQKSNSPQLYIQLIRDKSPAASGTVLVLTNTGNQDMVLFLDCLDVFIRQPQNSEQAATLEVRVNPQTLAATVRRGSKPTLVRVPPKSSASISGLDSIIQHILPTTVFIEAVYAVPDECGKGFDAWSGLARSFPLDLRS